MGRSTFSLTEEAKGVDAHRYVDPLGRGLSCIHILHLLRLIGSELSRRRLPPPGKKDTRGLLPLDLQSFAHCEMRRSLVVTKGGDLSRGRPPSLAKDTQALLP